MRRARARARAGARAGRCTTCCRRQPRCPRSRRSWTSLAEHRARRRQGAPQTRPPLTPAWARVRSSLRCKAKDTCSAMRCCEHSTSRAVCSWAPVRSHCACCLAGVQSQEVHCAAQRVVHASAQVKLCLRLSSGHTTDSRLPARSQPKSDTLTARLPWRQGVLALHSHKPPILHRDLKSPNLLIDKHWRCKIADFNLSRVMVRAAARPVCAMSCPVAQAGLPPIPTSKPRCRSGAGHVQPLGALLGIPWPRAPPVDHLRGAARRAVSAARARPRRIRRWCRRSPRTTRAGWHRRSSCTRCAPAPATCSRTRARRMRTPSRFETLPSCCSALTATARGALRACSLRACGCEPSAHGLHRAAALASEAAQRWGARTRSGTPRRRTCSVSRWCSGSWRSGGCPGRTWAPSRRARPRLKPWVRAGA